MSETEADRNQASEDGGAAADDALRATGIRKQYGGIHALEDADLVVRRAEVHALLGENGAGKSTLVKIVAGVVRQDAGEILVHGEPLNPGSPQDSGDARHRDRLPGALAGARALGDAQPGARRHAADAPAWSRFRKARRIAEEALAKLGLEHIDPRVARRPPAARPAPDGRDHQGLDAQPADPDPRRGDLLARRRRGRAAVRRSSAACATRARPSS